MYILTFLCAGECEAWIGFDEILMSHGIVQTAVRAARGVKSMAWLVWKIQLCLVDQGQFEKDGVLLIFQF